MAQRVIEGTDADAKLKQALLDKEAELRRSLDDADRCSTLQHSCTAALARAPQHLQHPPQHLQRAPQHLQHPPQHLQRALQHLQHPPQHLQHAPQLQRASCRPCTVGAHEP